MKKMLFTILLCLGTIASALNIGESVPTFKIKDQFKKEHIIKSDTKTILVAADKSMSEVLRDYLKAKPKGFLESHKTYYIGDISGMPSLIAKFFALPKMKDYPFSILLVDEEQTKSFSKKEDFITVYSLKEGKVTKIDYINNAEQLDAIFK